MRYFLMLKQTRYPLVLDHESQGILFNYHAWCNKAFSMPSVSGMSCHVIVTGIGITRNSTSRIFFFLFFFHKLQVQTCLHGSCTKVAAYTKAKLRHEASLHLAYGYVSYVEPFSEGHGRSFSG